MRKRGILLLSLLLILLIGIGSATLVPFYPEYSDEKTYSEVTFLTYNSAEEGYAISNSYINIVPGSDLQITLRFNDGRTKTGRVEYELENYGLSDTLTLSLDGDMETRSGPHVPGIDPSIRIGYMCENNTAFLMIMCDTLYYAMLDSPQVFTDTGSPSENPWVQLDVTSSTNMPFSAQIRVSSISEIGTAEEEWESGHSTLIDWLIANYMAIWDLLMMLWGIFSFFFIENLLFTLAMIEMGIIAYRLSTSRDIFRAFSHIIQDNERLLMGLIWFVQKLIEIIWDVVNFINPFRWVLGK